MLPSFARTAFAALALACSAQTQADARYKFTTLVYDSVRNAATPCGGGICADLPAGQRVAGYFTTAVPLAPNLTLSDDILPLVTDWRFGNGTTFFGKGDPGVRVLQLRVATDQAGKPLQAEIYVHRWQDKTDGPLHKIGDRVDAIIARTSPDNPERNATLLNVPCNVYGVTSQGVADACLVGAFQEDDPTSSIAKYPAPGRLVMDGVPLVTINDVAVDEGNTGTTDLAFTVSLDSAPTTAVSVDWATADGFQAKAGEDYIAASGTLTWAAGDVLPKAIIVKVKGDTVRESNETVKVLLSNLVGLGGGDSTVGTGTILNDDAAAPLPAISITPTASVPEGHSGTTPLRFIVSLSAAPSADVSVDWATADDTATAPSDYVQGQGTLQWSAGDATTRTISVLVKGDTTVEPDEQFSVHLSNALGATIDPAARDGVGTITNDDDGTAPPPGGVQPVPTLADWALLALSALLLGVGAALRKRMQA